MYKCRGYVASRPLLEQRVPQHVQNIVIRDYCRRKNLMYLLSAVEYIVPECYLMLERLLLDLSDLDGIVCYSLFQLPSAEERRRKVYEKVLQAGRSIHFAVESLMIDQEGHVEKIENIWNVESHMKETPSIEEVAIYSD